MMQTVRERGSGKRFEFQAELDIMSILFATLKCLTYVSVHRS
jgi:hypothetical protein